MRAFCILALTGCLLLAGCRGAPEASGDFAAEAGSAARGATATTDEYRVALALVAVEGRWRVTLNGFPIWDRTDAAAQTASNWIDPGLNTALVEAGNVLRVEVWPALGFGDGLAVGETDVRAEVVAVGKGPVAGTALDLASARASWVGEIRAQYASWRSAGVASPADSARVWAESHPVVAEVRFDVGFGQPSFDAVFREAPVIAGTAADSARLRAYALKLRDIVQEQDGDSYYAETRRELADKYAVAHAVYGDPILPHDTMRALRVRGIERPDWSFARGIITFEAEDVTLRSWSGGRVWELSRGGEPLLATPRVDGVQSRYNVYVGEADGALRVVRLE